MRSMLAGALVAGAAVGGSSAAAAVTLVPNTAPAPALATVPYDPQLAAQLILLSDAAYCADSRTAAGIRAVTEWTCPPCVAAATAARGGLRLEKVRVVANTTRSTLALVGIARRPPTARIGGAHGRRTDDGPDAVVVSLRGSVLSQNFVDDADQKLVPLPGSSGDPRRSGRVHRGLYASYSSLAPSLLQQVAELMRAHPSAIGEIIVTGHSMVSNRKPTRVPCNSSTAGSCSRSRSSRHRM
jgi:hypothetical protein